MRLGLGASPLSVSDRCSPASRGLQWRAVTDRGAGSIGMCDGIFYGGLA